MDNLIFVKNTTWQEVFEGWKIREANDPGWINCATKIKGWPDWESWRRYIASQFGAEKREWKIYQIVNANKVVPEVLVGPYTGWQNRLPEKNILSFAEMLKIIENYKAFSKNDKVLGMIKNWPISTQFIGIIRPDNGKIVCVEGHHRATAIALAKKNNQPLDFKSEVTIALAELVPGEEKLLDAILAKGSQNPGSLKLKWKKIVGIVLIIVGLLSLITPLTPGSWLVFVGLEIFGIRFIVADKFKNWLRSDKK